MAISLSRATHVQGNDKAAAQPLVAQQSAAATRPQQTAAQTKQQPTDTVQISAGSGASGISRNVGSDHKGSRRR
jgi:hypothetical protein